MFKVILEYRYRHTPSCTATNTPALSSTSKFVIDTISTSILMGKEGVGFSTWSILLASSTDKYPEVCAEMFCKCKAGLIAKRARVFLGTWCGLVGNLSIASFFRFSPSDSKCFKRLRKELLSESLRKRNFRSAVSSPAPNLRTQVDEDVSRSWIVSR